MEFSQITESDEGAAGIYSQWRQEFSSKSTRRSDIWSVTESALASEAAESEEGDCPFEYANDQSCAEELHEALEEDHQDQVEGDDWDLATQGVVRYGNGTVQEESSQVPRLVRRVFTYLNNRVEDMKNQFKKQEVWNGRMQQSVETMAERYDKLEAIEETLKTLQEEVDNLRLSREGTVERRTGRNKRTAQ
ncbi:hypothetical protein N7490_006267 [Penicillium lividum]|nr:hypothetical protein N7490_006267 [Penicillium lividum]